MQVIVKIDVELCDRDNKEYAQNDCDHKSNEYGYEERAGVMLYVKILGCACDDDSSDKADNRNAVKE